MRRRGTGGRLPAVNRIALADLRIRLEAEPTVASRGGSRAEPVHIEAGGWCGAEEAWRLLRPHDLVGDRVPALEPADDLPGTRVVFGRIAVAEVCQLLVVEAVQPYVLQE